MAISYTWSALTNGSTLPFDPSQDTLTFDGGISAADILFDSGTGGDAVFSYGGKVVTLDVSPYALTTTNVIFSNGSMLIIGGNDTVNGAGDTVAGQDDGANTIVGGAFDDMLIGAGGADTIFGGNGNDVLVVIPGTNGFYGNDTLNGGGNDTLTGNGDTLVYIDAEFGVTVGLTGGGASDTATGGDGSPGSTLTLLNIENVIATDFADSVVGSGAANFIEGGAGNDTLAGGGSGDSANDSLFGGDGDDFLRQTLGNDYIDGGAGNDRLTFQSSIIGGATVDLQNGTSSAGGGNATLSGIERVTGTSSADHLTASSSLDVNGLTTDVSNSFTPGAGNDTIVGSTGDGRGTVVSYQNAAAGVNVNLGAGTATIDGDGGSDTFDYSGGGNIDHVIGSGFADTLTGGGSATGVGGGLRESFEGRAGSDIIDGQGGRDEARYENAPDLVVVNLGSGPISGDFYGTGSATLQGGQAFDGYADTASVDTLLNIEAVRGSGFGDTLVGGDQDNRLEGLGGNDYIDGGGLFDVASYQHASGAVYVNLAAGTAQGFGGESDVGTDTLVSIEAVRGSDYADSLVGGGQGEGPGNDYFEEFEGGAGNDTIDGSTTNAGIDAVAYFRSPSGVIVNLSGATVLGVDPNRANDGYGVNSNPAGIDTLVNINAAEGSTFNDTLVGGEGSQYFYGNAGNDSIAGGNGIDAIFFGDQGETTGAVVNLGTGTVSQDGFGGTDVVSGIENAYGSGFNDNLTGDGNANELDGGESGDDTLTGGAGSDTLQGGPGTDTANYSGAAAGINVNLILGSSPDGDGGTDFLNSIENVVGSNSNDTIAGNSSSNLLQGLGGNDILDGGEGNDTIDGGLGTDSVTFATVSIGAGATVNLLTGSATDGAGSTYILTSIENFTGTQFNDNVTGTGIANVLAGGDGNDSLLGAAGNDTLQGGNGVDTASYAGAGSAATVNLGANTASDGNGGTDSLNSIENVIGSSFNDSLVGSSDANRLDGAGGADTMNGGLGNDTYVVGGAGDVVQETSASGGTDLVETSVTFTLPANVENLTLTGSAAVGIFGNTLVNLLIGNGSANVLDAGAAPDTMMGGDGNDIYYASGTTDVIVENPNQGTDTVITTVVYTLGAEIENLTLVGTGAFSISGNSLKNTLTGNDSNNALIGAGDADTMSGGLGNDTYGVDNAADVIIESTAGAPGGDDLVQASVSYVLGATNVERLTLTGASPNNATGNNFANTLTGNAANNVIDGSGGADTMIGGSGNDTYVVGSTLDVVQEVGGGGTADLIQSAVNYALPNNVENLTLLGGANLSGAGNTLPNVLTGNGGNNQLDGGGGADTMIGNAGNDTYIVNAFADVVDEGPGAAGLDLVLASVSFTLPANVENITLLGTASYNITGNGLSNVLTGNQSVNTLDGMGAADTLIGGDGDDTLVYDAADTLIDGGLGATDVLRVDGTGVLVNLTAIGDSVIQNMEVVRINGSGNNTLTLALTDVLAISSTTDTLRVDGNSGDVVNAGSGWAAGLDQVIGANTYHTYTQTGTALATLLVDTDITLNIS